MKFPRRHRYEDVDEEIQQHLRMAIRDRIERGETPEAAEINARREIGNVALVKETTHKMNPLAFFDQIMQDLRYAIRILATHRGFTVVAILSLGLGIGANTAIFQLLDVVTLRMLPVREPQQLTEMRIVNRHGISANYTGRNANLTYALWEQIQRNAESPSGQKIFSGVFAWGDDRFDLSQGGEARYVQAMWASGELFNVLGVRPFLGRVFTLSDDQKGSGTPTAVLSYQFWQREYGGDRSAIGKTITLEGKSYEIIGVAPPSFYGVESGGKFDVAVPIYSESAIYGEDSKIEHRTDFWLGAMGRLKPGVTVEQANAELAAVSPGIFQETLPATLTPESSKNYLSFRLGAFAAGTGVSSLRSTYNTPLLVLMAITGFVLLIACANLANLMLARASAREREFAVRLALGASRSRLVKQLLLESLLLALVGSSLGIFIARELSQFLIQFLNLSFDLSLDWRVLSFVASLAILTTLLFGLAPAFRATASAPATVLKSGRTMTSNKGRFDLRRILVVSQIAISLVLMIGALLFVKTLRNLSTVDTGFQAEGALLANFDMTRAVGNGERTASMREELLERLRAIPGINAAATVVNAPIQGSTWRQNVLVDQQPKQPSYINEVSSDYFNASGISMIAGRDFNNEDTPSSQRVAIVNEKFAQKFLNGENPVGRMFQFEGRPNQPNPIFQIIGLVKNSKYSDVREDFPPTIYKAVSQDDAPDPAPDVLIRSRSSITTLFPAIKQTVAESNPNITMSIQRLSDQISSSLKPEQLMAMLSGFFGALAALLAIIGLYGVMSYTVSQRRNEIGIRIALGATQTRVIKMIINEVAILLLIGLVVGTVTAFFVAKTANSLLFGLKSNDPATFAIGIAALALVGLLAGLIPAYRASKSDPMNALRYE